LCPPRSRGALPPSGTRPAASRLVRSLRSRAEFMVRSGDVWRSLLRLAGAELQRPEGRGDRPFGLARPLSRCRRPFAVRRIEVEALDQVARHLEQRLLHRQLQRQWRPSRTTFPVELGSLPVCPRDDRSGQQRTGVGVADAPCGGKIRVKQRMKFWMKRAGDGTATDPDAAEGSRSVGRALTPPRVLPYNRHTCMILAYRASTRAGRQ